LLTPGVTPCAGVEGGQKSAGDVLHHLFVVADHRQPPARSRSLSLFLRVRSRFLNYYPDVYRYTSFSIIFHFIFHL
jgi:hypothetical protein